MTTLTGVVAITIPAITPAVRPSERRIVAINTTTVATPIRACGRRMASGESPKARTESPITMVESGGLSVARKFSGSTAEKSQAVQSLDPAQAAAL